MKFLKTYLKHYYIIDGPCTALVKVSSNVGKRNLIDDSSPRYLIPLRVGKKEDLIKATELIDSGCCTFKEVRHCFVTGAVFKNTLNSIDELPVKGESVIATFDYVNDILMCTSITLLPRIKLKAFDPDGYDKAKSLYDTIINSSKKY